MKASESRSQKASSTMVAEAQVTVRRKPFWRPMLRPAALRKLPPDLYPQAVYKHAGKLERGLQGRAYETLIRRIDQSPFHRDTRATPFFAGGAAFEAMLDAINAARYEVLVEAYVLRGDDTGRAFLAALKTAVRRGVDVKVLADAFGSSRTRRQFWGLMKRSGSRIRLFRGPHYAPLSLLPVLDHRKLLVVDRKVAFTGGMNIADEYRYGRPGDTAWRDTHVMLRGGVVWELAVIFAESWVAAGGDPMHFEGLSPERGGGVSALVLDSRPGRGMNEVFSAYAATLGAARERVWITNAYFAPGRRMLHMLKDTARRGVDVRLLVPGFCDIPIIRTATQGYYRELLRAGVKIFEYLPSVLHAKTLVADGRVGLIGSTNFDFRSFNFNAECNVLFHNDDLARQMEAAFTKDLENALPVTMEVWHARPLKTRMLAWLARKVAPLM